MWRKDTRSHLLFVFRGAPLILVVTFTIGLTLAARAGLLGIPLALILISWFFKYAFVLFDAIVAGDEDPPVLSVEMVNPVDEQRPLAQAALIAGAVWLVTIVASALGDVAASALALALLAVLPASIATLGITRNIFLAAWPGNWFQVIRGLKADYLWVSLGTLACAGAIYGLWRLSTSLLLTVAATQWLLLAIFTVLASALHADRFELGIETRTRRERQADLDRRDHERARRRMLDEAHGLLRTRDAPKAFDTIQAWLAVHSGRDVWRVEHRAVLETVMQWDDPRIADRLANDYIAALLADRNNSEALEVLERRLASNPRFRPKQAAHTARLLELAALAGKRALRRQLESTSFR